MLDLLNRLRGRTFGASAIPDITVATVEPEYQSHLSRVRNMAMAVAVKKMFTDHHFSICDLDKLLDAARIIPDGEVYRTLRLLHCVNWMDMPKELRMEVHRMVVDMLETARSATL